MRASNSVDQCVGGSLIGLQPLQHHQDATSRVAAWGDKNNLWITKGRRTIRFDIKIETPEGCVFAMYITREREGEMGNVAAENNNKNKKTTMTFRQAHDRLGHMSDATTRETAKRLGLHITKMQTLPCAACAAGKAKQKNIKRTETTKQKIGQ